MNSEQLKPSTSHVHFDESPTSSVCPLFSTLTKTTSYTSDSSGQSYAHSIQDQDWILHHTRFISASGVYLDNSVRPLLRLIESGDEFEKFWICSPRSYST